jgi:hypothetical protein
VPTDFSCLASAGREHGAAPRPPNRAAPEPPSRHRRTPGKTPARTRTLTPSSVQRTFPSAMPRVRLQRSPVDSAAVAVSGALVASAAPRPTLVDASGEFRAIASSGRAADWTESANDRQTESVPRDQSSLDPRRTLLRLRWERARRSLCPPKSTPPSDSRGQRTTQCPAPSRECVSDGFDGTGKRLGVIKRSATAIASRRLPAHN